MKFKSILLKKKKYLFRHEDIEMVNFNDKNFLDARLFMDVV